MKAKAVRLYGKNDLRLEEFDLPKISDEEILAKVICDSLCMSSYKAAHEADVHKRVPRDIAQNPTIIGHEFAGEIVEVGSRWKEQFKVGDKFAIQPALNDPNGPVGILSAPGYSYKYLGGNSTYVIVPKEVMELGCLLRYEGPGYYPASLAEPLSCVIGAMHANYHTTPGSYIHKMEIVQGGDMAILAGVGPMGLAAINYAINRKDRQPGLLIVTDIDQSRLDRAAWLYPPAHAAKNGIDLRYVNTATLENPIAELRAMTKDSKGFDDVFVFVPIPALVEQADDLLAFDGCLNFFAGPPNPDFKAPLNFYNVHYAYTHIVGTSGGNTSDLREALELQAAGHDASGFVTHVGGIDSVIDTTMRLPAIGGGKKLMYMHFNMPLTALTEFEERGKTNPVFAHLDQLVKSNKGLWSLECEAYLLANSDKI